MEQYYRLSACKREVGGSDGDGVAGGGNEGDSLGVCVEQLCGKAAQNFGAGMEPALFAKHRQQATCGSHFAKTDRDSRAERNVALYGTADVNHPLLCPDHQFLRKDRQVLSAQGVTVYQECKAISGDIQAALRTLQSNAAVRASKKKGGAGAKGKSF